MVSNYPLVSAIMPTANRQHVARQAAEMFLAQSWPNKELVVIDDGLRETLLPDHPQIRYIRVSRTGALGAKRNLACSHARGEFICHWDDDDIYTADRIEHQVLGLLASPRHQLTGYHTMLFADESTGALWRWHYHSRDNAIGVSLMYRRQFWAEHRFDAGRNVGEEDALLHPARGRAQLLANDSEGRIIATIHNRNTAPRDMSLQEWESAGMTFPDYLLLHGDPRAKTPEGVLVN